MFKRMLSLSAVILACFASYAFSAEIKLGGGGASIATVFNPVKAAFEKATGHNLIILQGTPVSGLKELWEGKLDVSVTAVGLDGMIAGVAKGGVTVDKTVLNVFEVGTNKTVVFVNPANKVSALTKEQMKGIFTGKVANWKEVGGNDEPILVVWGKNSPGQNALFTKVILDGENVTAENLETTDYKGIKETVASNPGAVGIDPLGMLDASVKGIKPSPEANSTILLITKGAPSPAVKQLLDFVKGEGKQYIKE